MLTILLVASWIEMIFIVIVSMILLLSYHNLYLKMFCEEYCNNGKNHSKQKSLSKLLTNTNNYLVLLINH